MNFSYSIAVILGTLAFGLIAIPSYIRIARAKQIVDVPNQRSSHSIPTPRGGGIFIPIGLIGFLTVTLFFDGPPATSWSLLASLCVVSALGFIDDIKSLPSLSRLAAHLACGATIAIAYLPSQSLLISAIAITLYIIWIVGCLNIYNFMDGIDGIATCQGIIAASVWAFIATSENNSIGQVLAYAALGGLFAFLCFNWPPAKVFMGDSASGTLGFLFGALPLVVADGDLATHWRFLNYGALALLPFLFDGTFTLCRRTTAILTENGRLKMGRLPKLIQLTEAHRSHIYQRWVQSGKSHRFVTIAYAIWATLCGTAAVFAFSGLISISVSWLVAGIPAVGLLWHSRRFPR